MSLEKIAEWFDHLPEMSKTWEENSYLYEYGRHQKVPTMLIDYTILRSFWWYKDIPEIYAYHEKFIRISEAVSYRKKLLESICEEMCKEINDRYFPSINLLETVIKFNNIADSTTKKKCIEMLYADSKMNHAQIVILSLFIDPNARHHDILFESIEHQIY